jgi:hypothetical protein
VPGTFLLEIERVFNGGYRHGMRGWGDAWRFAARITLFLGSDNGGTAAAVLYSILASAKANQVEPFAYVRNLLSQLSDCSPPAVATLLPDAWLAAHPESRRCWSR